jgi:hypothetical protein
MDDEDFWDAVLAHMRDRVLVPVVGPKVNLVDAGNTQQTFDSIVGRHLAERCHLDVPTGETTIADVVAAFLRKQGQLDVQPLYSKINNIIRELDPTPGPALRGLAEIDDFRLFVSTTPDQLLAKAIKEVRFHGQRCPVQIAFSPLHGTPTQDKNDEEPPPIPSSSACLGVPPPHLSMQFTMRTGWSGYMRC